MKPIARIRAWFAVPEETPLEQLEQQQFEQWRDQVRATADEPFDWKSYGDGLPTNADVAKQLAEARRKRECLERWHL